LSQLTSYQKRLFVFLSVATFFEGYDFMALSQILPNLRADMALSEAQGGLLGSVISLGTVLAFVLVRLADRWGRRRVLAITILGYAAFTFLTGLSRAPYDFALYQFIARVFLIAEWALCMVIAAEEYPAEKRGFVIGVIQASNSLGSITCAAIAPFLLQTSPGWRMVYFVGVLPLLLLAYARRGLKETTRYAEYAAARQETRHSLFAILRSPYRTRVLQMALIWGLTYICTNTAVLFWKEFAVGQRGFTDGEVGKAVAIASIGALPFVFFIGKLLDTWGRRAAIALLALLNTYTTELFPTEMRADAFAWSNNLLGRIGYVIAPGIVGWAAGYMGWGNAVSLTAISVIAALILILALLPETSRRELEETAQL
jgi:putative MFS transporter